MRHQATLANAQHGHEMLRRAWEWAKPRLIAGHRIVLSLEEETRSGPQNRLLHAKLGDIARRREWAGRKWDSEVWKRLLVAAWLRASGKSVMLLPALDNMGVDAVFQATHKLSRKECADLIDWIDAWDAGA